MKIVKEKVEVAHEIIITEAIQRSAKRFTADKELIDESINSLLERGYIEKTLK